MEQVRSIWTKYATAEGKFYMNFSDMLSDSSDNLGKIKKLSDEMDNLKKEVKSCNEQIERLEEKISEQDRKLTELEETKKGYTRNAQISGGESNGGKKDTIMEILLAKLEKAGNAKSALEKNKAEAEGELNKLKEQIEERNKQIEELNQQMDVSKMRRPTEKERHWSGLLYKSNDNTSSLGKAKQSYARTLCRNLKYTPWSRGSNELDLSLD